MCLLLAHRCSWTKAAVAVLRIRAFPTTRLHIPPLRRGAKRPKSRLQPSLSNVLVHEINPHARSLVSWRPPRLRWFLGDDMGRGLYTRLLASVTSLEARRPGDPVARSAVRRGVARRLLAVASGAGARQGFLAPRVDSPRLIAVAGHVAQVFRPEAVRPVLVLLALHKILYTTSPVLAQ